MSFARAVRVSVSFRAGRCWREQPSPDLVLQSAVVCKGIGQARHVCRMWVEAHIWVADGEAVAAASGDDLLGFSTP